LQAYRARDSINAIVLKGAFMDIGITDKNRTQICAILNVILANEYVLYTKTLKFHWNVEGRQFHDLHVFFRHQYEAIFSYVDDVAERVTTLGGKSFGTLQEFSKNSTLQENPALHPKDLDMIAQLLADHETIIKQLRKDVETTQNLGDAGTSNFLTDLMEKHEKLAWMLRAHLAK
jgi:starvation-inducible DNA-binding protein